MTALPPTPAQLAANSADPLAGLRDIHLPEAIGWWPPAIGWWLVLASMMLLIGAIYCWLRWRKIQKNKAIVFSNSDIIQAALVELAAIEIDSIELDSNAAEQNQHILSELSQLLRRCAVQISHLDADSHATPGLTGKAWLVWLDQRWDRHDFSQGSGQLLIDAPYRQSSISPDDFSALVQISRAWMEQQR